MDIKETLEEAFNLASQATQKYIDQNPEQWFPCGFSSVRISPARGKVVQYLKNAGIGYTDEYQGGYVIYNPSQNATQSMDAKVEGSKAFAQKLQELGVKCRVESRID